MLNYFSVWSGIAGVAVTVIFGAAPHMGLKISPRLARGGLWAGIVLLVLSPLVFFLRDKGRVHDGKTNIGPAFIQNFGNSNSFNFMPAPALRRQQIRRHLTDLEPQERKYFIALVTRVTPALSTFLSERDSGSPSRSSPQLPYVLDTMRQYQLRFATDIASISDIASSLGWLQGFEKSTLDNPTNPLGLQESLRILSVLAGRIHAETTNE